jgi:hypothetical protein
VWSRFAGVIAVVRVDEVCAVNDVEVGFPGWVVGALRIVSPLNKVLKQAFAPSVARVALLRVSAGLQDRFDDVLCVILDVRVSSFYVSFRIDYLTRQRRLNFVQQLQMEHVVYSV